MRTGKRQRSISLSGMQLETRTFTTWPTSGHGQRNASSSCTRSTTGYPSDRSTNGMSTWPKTTKTAYQSLLDVRATSKRKDRYQRSWLLRKQMSSGASCTMRHHPCKIMVQSRIYSKQSPRRSADVKFSRQTRTNNKDKEISNETPKRNIGPPWQLI